MLCVHINMLETINCNKIINQSSSTGILKGILFIIVNAHTCKQQEEGGTKF